jgi:hypothetical protein
MADGWQESSNWHCCLELYSVTTRLPEEYRLEPEVALRFLREEIFPRFGPPPQVVWVTCGNRGNPALKDLIIRSWPRVRELLAAGEALLEINQIRDLAK